MNVVSMEESRISVGDFITVDDWISHRDNSYKGDVCKVLAVDRNLLRVENFDFKVCPYLTFDTNRVKVRKLSDEFVKVYFGSLA